MIKKEISVEKYKEDFNKMNGVYVYILSDCSLCDDHLKRLEESKMFDEINLVNCLEDIDYFWQEQGLDDMPVTRCYFEGDVMYEKGGVFYDKQQKELKEVINQCSIS